MLLLKKQDYCALCVVQYKEAKRTEHTPAAAIIGTAFVYQLRLSVSPEISCKPSQKPGQ